MDIRLNKKTGFKSKSPIVTVWTDEGEPFYIIKRKGTEILFNLPKGNYIIECDFEILKSPVNYKLPKLPKNFKLIKKLLSKLVGCLFSAQSDMKADELITN